MLPCLNRKCMTCQLIDYDGDRDQPRTGHVPGPPEWAQCVPGSQMLHTLLGEQTLASVKSQQCVGEYACGCVINGQLNFLLGSMWKSQQHLWETSRKIHCIFKKTGGYLEIFQFTRDSIWNKRYRGRQYDQSSCAIRSLLHLHVHTTKILYTLKKNFHLQHLSSLFWWFTQPLPGGGGGLKCPWVMVTESQHY